MTPTLARHIQEQQNRACTLEGVIEAIAFIDNDVGRNSAVTALVEVALAMAHDLNCALDAAALPQEDRA